MTDRFSLLKALKNPGYEAAVMTTFNCYLPFLEEVVIRRLSAVGCRHNLVLADRDQLTIAIDSNPPSRSGIDYWLLPIDSAKAFHPKLTLMVGKDKGQLFVGSHNLTYSGFGGNREVTNTITFNKRSNADSLPIFKQAVEALRSWAERANAPGVDEAFAQLLELGPWLKDASSDSDITNHLIVSGPGHPALFSQLTELCSPPIRDIVVSGAFFDGEAQFLKQLQDSFTPNRFIVAVQPNTVQLPPAAQSLVDVQFVSAEQLGPNSDDYLHAKFVYLITDDDRHVFASGSANPSRPAWLDADTAANDEAMLFRFGTDAQLAAASMGIDIEALHGQPALTEDQWSSVRTQWSMAQHKSEDSSSPPLKFGVSVEPGIVILDSPSFSAGANFQFLGSNELVLPIEYRAEPLAERARLTFDKSIEVPVIRELLNNSVVAHHLIHYQTTLEEHARTGAQRKFRTSLASLDADSPELNTLFRCVEQVILDPEIYSRRTVPSVPEQQADDDRETPDTLQVDINSIANTTRRKRMSDGTDLGYILELLIKSMSQATSDSYRSTDIQGRDEEEQVGADDEFDDQEAERKQNDEQATKILALCHRKVGQLVRRTRSELERTTREDLPIDSTILKLTAILALLRHLKAHESIIWWVKEQRGETAVPREYLQLLCDAVLTFLESNESLSTGSTDDQEALANFEETGRLKGLVFWLAIESGVQLDFDAEFNETADSARERIQNNTNFIAFGNMMAEDNQAIDEARETIRVTNAAAMASLHQAIQLHHVIKSRKANALEFETHPKSGDLAFHPTVATLGVRCILSCDENRTQIARLGRGEPKKFTSKSLRYLAFESIQRDLRQRLRTRHSDTTTIF